MENPIVDLCSEEHKIRFALMTSTCLADFNEKIYVVYQDKKYKPELFTEQYLN